MNILGYLQELDEELNPQPVVKVTNAALSESEKVRAWFNGLNFDGMQAG